MYQTLKIVADAHIWGVESAFSTLPGYDVELNILESREITRDTVIDADILLTRSSTKVQAKLLQGTAVRFAATATVGDDHYDKAWLESNNIRWASAAGSSTGSVIEYMISSLLDLHEKKLISIPDTTIGIIGVGRIGHEMEKLCRAMGMKVMLNDPPRERAEKLSGFSSLEEILEQADLITLHTPLVIEGEECTKHLLNRERLKQFRGKGIMNAARGSCIDNGALLGWLNGHSSRFAALDCWELEPSPAQALFSHAQMAIATPHIAGHSLDGKAANTQFIYQALCHVLQTQPVWNKNEHLPQDAAPHVLSTTGDCWEKLHTACNFLYPLCKDSETMKSWSSLSHNELSDAFTCYRRHYPIRRAWQHTALHFSHPDPGTLQLAQAIGIKLV